MKKWNSLCLACAVGAATGAFGQTTIFDSSVGSYSNGDLAGQENWSRMLNVDTNNVPYPEGSNQLDAVAFNVDGNDWINTDGVTVSNGGFVRLTSPIAANLQDDEVTITMDFNFSVPDGGAAGIEMPNSEFFYIGLTANPNGGLSEFDTNDVCFVLRTRAENGRLDLNFQSGDQSDRRIIQAKPEELGWAPEAVTEDLTPVPADYMTDDLRLTMTMRKTRVSNTYTAWATLENMASNITLSGIFSDPSNRVVSTTFSTGAFASNSLYLAMGRTSQATNIPSGDLDIAIDDLNVLVENIAPTQVPGNFNAFAGDEKVALAWDAVTEASGYDVFRSTTNGVYGPKLTTVTTNAYEDTGLTNDQTYYYVVQAVYAGTANSANSDEKSATPMKIFVDESIINTSFVSGEGYSDDDLAGQLSGLWQAIDGSSNNAFSVVNSGTTGEADSSIVSNHDMDVGNGVYVNRLISNNEGDMIDGSITFVATAADDLGLGYANLKNKSTFTFGVSGDKDSAHANWWDADKAILTLCQYANGDMAVSFGAGGNVGESQRLAFLTRAELGWDPENQTTPDWSTERIQVNFTLRKTFETDVYEATAELINLDTPVTNSGVTSLIATRAAAYNSGSVYFTMSHYQEAKKDLDDSLVNIALYDVSVDQTSGNDPVVLAPTGLATLGGDRSVSLTWDAMLEASEYEIYMSENNGVAGDLIATVSGATYVDQPRFNGDTLYYTVLAIYPNGSALSTEEPGSPIASKKHIDWDGEKAAGNNVASAKFNIEQVSNIQSNGTISWIDYSSTPVLSSSEYSAYENVDLYGLTQHDPESADISGGKGVAGYEMQIKNSNGIEADSFDLWAANGSMQQLAYVKVEDMSEAPAVIDLTDGSHSVIVANKLMSVGAQHVAIRNGNDWYVSESVGANGSLNIPAGILTIENLEDEAWGAMSVSPGTWMTAPGTFDADTSTFTNVNAIGWFWSGGSGARLKTYKLTYSASGSVPSFTFWADANGVDKNGNEDGDMLNNIQEYAFGGNPNIPYQDGDGAVLPQYFEAYTHNAVDGFLVKFNELRDPAPGISYSVETTENLAVQNGWDPADAEEINRVRLNYNWDVVTYFVPMDTAAKFVEIKLLDAE